MKNYWIWLATLSLCACPLACGGKDNSGDDDDDGSAASDNTTSGSSTTGAPNAADCPSSTPGNASDCANYDPGLACNYGTVTCSCSGITWNCVGGNDSNDSGSGSNDNDGSSNSTTGSDQFGGTGGAGNSNTTGFSTDCEGITPENGAECSESGTVCGLEAGSSDTCVCIALGSDTPTWTCAGGNLGFGGTDGTGTGNSDTTGFSTDCEGITPENGAECSESGTVCGLEAGSSDTCVCIALGSDTPTWTCIGGN